MKIRTQLIVGIVIFAVLLAIISAFVIGTNQKVDQLSEQEKTANNIAIEVGELGYLSNDYILYREPQQADRWNAKFASISGDIAKLSVDQPEQQAITGNLAANLRNTKSVFDDIASSTIQPGGAGTSFIQLSWSRTAVQNQGMIFDANRLAGLIRAEADGLKQTRTILIFVLMGAFATLLLTSYFLGARRMLRSLDNLQKGADVVGSGDFTKIIEVNSDDEVGDLARSFNRMTMDLRDVTARKADLEAEVAERMRVEAALAQKNEELGTLNEELTASHEELTAINEELNATNEELATAHEDLQRNVDKLEKSGEILRKNETDLREALDEKEILLSEIHHRVKNNLAAFISLLSLEGSYEETPAGQALKNDLQNRARSMALIHETLYKTKKYSNVDMDIYLSTLVQQITGSYATAKSVATTVEAKGVMLDIGRATPCGLIINELVTNSFKYAFPEMFECSTIRGEPCSIRVSLSKDTEGYLLTIADNGTGLPPEFDITTAQSLGLKLVNFLARHQLRAKIDVRTEAGTEFSIRFRA